MVEEEKKDIDQNSVPAADVGDDEQLFIDEEQFQNVVPEFGSCGKDADAAGNEDPNEEGKTSCAKTDCCKNTTNTT